MKKILLLIPAILSCFFLFNSCKKNSVEEQYTETLHQVVPDLSTQVNASVNGFITDENGAAVEGATVKGGTITVVTDAYGYFKISGVNFAKSAGFIQVTKTGYFTGIRTFLPVAARETFIHLQLIPKTITGSINSTSGGTVSTIDGASVTLPANAVVVASNNASYTGTINIAIHWLNPADMDVTHLTMPGDLRGIDSLGYLQSLTTYGMLAVELTGDAGQLLQIANGIKASLSFPIPASLESIAPASIPLWYFNETNGLWKEDGAAGKNSGNYIGEVSHFTTWNCDQPGPSSVINFTAQIINDSLQPISNVAVSISTTASANSSSFAYTNDSGMINMMVPINTPFVLKLGAGCNPSVYTQNIPASTTNTDLGSIKINVLQYGASFKGTVNNCNGLPVTNGYVIITSSLYSNAVEVNNGIFNSGAVLICPNSIASVIAFDRTTSQESAVQNVTAVTGTNDFGTLSACTPPTAEGITYSIDGTTTNLATPFFLFAGNFDFGNTSTNVNAYDQLNSTTTFNIDFSGIDATSGAHTLTGGSILLNGATYYGTFPNFAISNYGLIGEFISGTFSGSATDGSGNPHTIDCSFNVLREQ